MFRNRHLRLREGDIPVRVLRPGKTRWTRGHAVWVSDVFAWRGFPAGWNEDLVHVVKATERSATSEELNALRRLGETPAVMSLTNEAGADLVVAASSELHAALLGPFAGATTPRV